MAVAAAVPVDADPAEPGEAQHGVGAPQGRSERVGNARLAAVPATVPLCHAIGKARGLDRLLDHREALGPHRRGAGIGLHQLLDRRFRSEEHTSELQSLMRISYAVFCLKKKKKK